MKWVLGREFLKQKGSPYMRQPRNDRCQWAVSHHSLFYSSFLFSVNKYYQNALSTPTCWMSGMTSFELLLQHQPRAYDVASRFLSKVFFVPILRRKKCHYLQFIRTDRPGRLTLPSSLLSIFLTLNCLQCQYQLLCLLSFTVTVFGISRGWVHVARSHRLMGIVETFLSL